MSEEVVRAIREQAQEDAELLREFSLVNGGTRRNRDEYEGYAMKSLFVGFLLEFILIPMTWTLVAVAAGNIIYWLFVH